MATSASEHDAAANLAEAVLAGDRTALGKAVTLVESTRDADRDIAAALLERLAPAAGGAQRIGVTGVPGSGKSTLIDVLGARLIESGHSVGVLAVDPTSAVSGGSILGDKTRMTRLADQPKAFVRPSPSSGVLGGVTSATAEVITVLEAAGYDRVLVETVGVGQSEAEVHACVDCVCMLTLTGAGDDLQAVKRGLMELADIIVVHKADGVNEPPARLAAAELRQALKLLAGADGGWTLPVLTVSALSGAGVDDLVERIAGHHRILKSSGELEARRARGRLARMRRLIESRLSQRLASDPPLADRFDSLRAAVAAGRTTPDSAVDALLAASGLSAAQRDDSAREAPAPDDAATSGASGAQGADARVLRLGSVATSGARGARGADADLTGALSAISFAHEARGDHMFGDQAPAGGDAATPRARQGVWTIVVAAGQGRRFGGAKQFSGLGGALVIDWSVRRAARWSEGVVVVLPRSHASDWRPWSPRGSRLLAGCGIEIAVTPGGVTRSDSVRCGLARVQDEAQVVLVHDGARPLADDGVYARVIEAVRGGADGAVPVVEISDTLRRRGGGAVDRREYAAVQTPQGFSASWLRSAHADGGDATDDATLVEAVGGRVVTVDGDPANIKITAPHDLAVAEILLSATDAPTARRESVGG